MTMTTDELNVLRAARMHRVMNKLKSVSAFSNDLGMNDAGDLSFTRTGSSYLPGSVGDNTNLMMSCTGRQPQININRTICKAQLTVTDTSIKKDHPLEEVIVLYDYQAQRSDELSLKRGDRITVLFKDNDNWWMGELADGQQGFFPTNYVNQPEKQWPVKKDYDVDSDNERPSRVHAVQTKTGELKFFSADEESDTDRPKLTSQKKQPRRRSEKCRQETIEMTQLSPKS